MSVLDEAGPQRGGQEIDGAALASFLRAQGMQAAASVDVQQFPGGASNLTYLATSGAEEWVVRRAPPGARSKAAHDVVREARLMQALRPSYPLVPRVLATCEDESVLGTQFYVMERLRGVIPRRNFPRALDVPPARARMLCTRFVEALTQLHAVDVEASGLAAFGKGQGYVRRQIEGWTERYARARTPDVPDFARVTTWLRARMPAREQRIVVVHNDFRFDNVVLDAEDDLRFVGVLDWEMATVGCPLMDLGASLAYWIEAADGPAELAVRRQPTHVDGMLTRAELWSLYLEKSGLGDDVDRPFYEVYGLFRLAGILQQLYARFVAGQLQSDEVAMFGLLVTSLEQRALRAMEHA